MKDTERRQERIPDNIKKYEEKIEGFLEKLLRETYLTRGGFKEKPEFATIYSKYDDLFSLNTINQIKKAEIPEKRKRFLLEFVMKYYFEKQVKEINDRIIQRILASTVTWKDTTVPFREIPRMISNADDIQTRHALHELLMVETEKMDPLRKEKYERLNTHARNIGYKNYAHLCNELSSLRLPYLNSMMKPFLEETRETYFTLLDNLLKKHKIERTEAWSCDKTRFQRTPEFDAHFDKERLVPHLESTLQDLGISLSDQPNITIDTEPRPLKAVRPFVVPLKIPDDIKIVISSGYGFTSYRQLFHETGHAQHYAHIEPSLPFTYKLLGDGTIEEGYAFLLENLLYNRYWLQKYFDSLDVKEFVNAVYELRFSFLRTFGVKIQYEELLFTYSDITEAQKVYSELFTQHMGVLFDRRNYLADVDAAFKSGIYLRAWIFEGQISNYLEKNFGEDWFTKADAGEFLKGLWRKGMELTAEEILNELGYDDLDVKYIQDRLLQAAEWAGRS